jgi:cbb3-type cytochrome oxidase subunit 1
MDSFVRRFIRSSLLWLGVGVAIGVAMALDPRYVGFRPAHMHANLLGFVSMMIFGVGYHVFPRFVGRPLYYRRMAEVHLWLANLGLAGMVGGFILRIYRWHPGMLLLGAGAALSAAGALCFILNIWRTLEPAQARAGALPRTEVR